MAHEQQGHVLLRDQLAQQPQHFGLDGHIERGRRLVRDQQGRLGGQGHGEGHPLALAAGDLVRKRAGDPVRLRQLNPVEGGGDGASQLRPAQTPVAAQRFGDLPSDTHQRIERREGFLEHHPRTPAAQRTQPGLGRTHHLGPAQSRRVQHHAPGGGQTRRQQSHDREGGQ